MQNKRRRISEEGTSPPVKPPSSPTRTKPNVLPSFMTPTKASLAKSYPHLVQKSVPRGGAERVTSPIRQPPRRSIPPEQQLTEVLGVNGGPNQIPAPGRSFLDIANEDEENVEEQMQNGKNTTAKTKGKDVGMEKHLSTEEEMERQRGVLMRRLRLLRAECENLEQKVEQATQAKENLDAQEKTQQDVDATIQLLLQSNDMSLSRQQPQVTVSKPAIPSAAPKQLKNPLPLLRFIHPLTFYSTASHLIPVNDELIRHYQLKGYALEKELYFDINMSVNEKQAHITSLEIKTSPWASAELSPFLKRIQTQRNTQMALTALSTYAKISSQRSLIFSRLAQDLIDYLSGHISTTITLISSDKGKERESDTSLPAHRGKRLWLGERNISFQRGSMGIVVAWDIIIDDLGFAGSKLSLATKFSQNWRDADDRNVLDGLPGVFDSLVRRFDVEQAVRTIVGIVFEDE